MSRFGEMFIEWAAFWAMYIVSMAVEAYVSGRLTFSYVLVVLA